MVALQRAAKEKSMSDAFCRARHASLRYQCGKNLADTRENPLHVRNAQASGSVQHADRTATAAWPYPSYRSGTWPDTETHRKLKGLLPVARLGSDRSQSSVGRRLIFPAKAGLGQLPALSTAARTGKQVNTYDVNL